MKKSVLFLGLSSLLMGAVLKDANVTLYKVDTNASKSVVTTTTTDKNGSYEIKELPVTKTDGNLSDFYYEVEITDGNQTVSAPVAVSTGGEKELNTSKATTIATKVLGEVVQSNEKNITIPPSEMIINNLSKAVKKDIEKVANKIDKIDLSDKNETTTMAGGLTTLNGSIEALEVASQFATDYKTLKADKNSSVESYAGYLTRVLKRACKRVSINDVADATKNPLPYKLAKIVGEMEKNGEKLKIEVLINVMNGQVGFNDFNLNYVNEYKNVLTAIENKVAKGEGLTDIEAAIFFTMRDLKSASITKDTELALDQAITFIYAMYEQKLENENGNDQNIMCQLGKADGAESKTLAYSNNLTKVVANIADKLSLPTNNFISDYVLFSDSGFGCSGKGTHLRANISAYTKSGVKLKSVLISSSEKSDLNGTGSFLFNKVYSGFAEVQKNGICVTTNKDINYTIVATFDDNTTDTLNISTRHYEVPESNNTYKGQQVSGDGSNPTDTNGVVRPLFTWNNPVVVKNNITGAPLLSKVVYTYELWHTTQTDPNSIVSNSCGKDETHRFYKTSAFIPSVDCNTSCASNSDIICRVNIQTFLLDKFNKPIGQAAGGFTYFRP